jgi:predicted DNA-binding helix-hairpin-helix protein
LKFETIPEWARLDIANARRIHLTVAPDGTADVHMGWMAVPSRLALGIPVDLNQASTADLALVPGISEELAARIVMTRQRAGGFSRMDDLVDVKGIGPATLTRLEPFLTLGTVH